MRATTRRNKSGEVVRYLQLAHNEWDAQAGVSRTKVLHSFGREDELDRAAVERLVASLSKLLDPPQGGGPRRPGETWSFARPGRSAEPTSSMPCGGAWAWMR